MHIFKVARALLIFFSCGYLTYIATTGFQAVLTGEIGYINTYMYLKYFILISIIKYCYCQGFFSEYWQSFRQAVNELFQWEKNYPLYPLSFSLSLYSQSEIINNPDSRSPWNKFHIRSCYIQGSRECGNWPKHKRFSFVHFLPWLACPDSPWRTLRRKGKYIFIQHCFWSLFILICV